jgi:hypothetical protein
LAAGPQAAAAIEVAAAIAVTAFLKREGPRSTAEGRNDGPDDVAARGESEDFGVFSDIKYELKANTLYHILPINQIGKNNILFK